MEETAFYHAIAVAVHGDYHAMKKCRAAGDSWEDAYDALKKSGVALPRPDRAADELARFGIRLILSSQREYPERLRHIPHPPFGMYVRGDLAAAAAAIANPLTLAIVGTRRASAEGKQTARDFARTLAGAGFTIASGLAFGIDAAAHEGCLDGGGYTIAILASGLDRVYPQAHDALAQKILARGGALISEYPPGEEPFGYRFIERNRIMSGVARGVLVVEAPESSGALATARFAAEQNRDLFVVPGSVTSTHYKGSHTLIRQGAELVAGPNDILEAYGIAKEERSPARACGESPHEVAILNALAAIGMVADVDKLVAMTKLEPRIVTSALTFLTLRGIIKESDEGYTI